MKKLIVSWLLGSLTVFASAQVTETFINLDDGAIDGQGAFTGAGEVIPDPDDPFGNKLLSIGAQSFAFHTTYALPAGIEPRGFSMDFSLTPHPDRNAGDVEFFVIFDPGWNYFLAAKWEDGEDDPGNFFVEARTSGAVDPVIGDGLTLAFDEMNTLEFVLNSTGTVGTFSLNGSHLVTLEDLNPGVINWDAFTQFQFATQRAEVLVDQFTVIPEPSTYALLFGTLFLGFAAWRRFRR